MASVDYPVGKADKNWALPRKATQKHATQTDSFEKSPPPPEPDSADKKKGNPWLWGLGGLLAVVAVGVGVKLALIC